MSGKPLHLRNRPWDMFPHHDFIAFIAQYIKPEVFVEYGVSDCGTTSKTAPHCKRYIGVDIASHPNMDSIPNLEFHQETTREFKTNFLDHNPELKIDIAFIDADHKFESAWEDFEDLWSHITDNGIIFLHDTYPTELSFLSPGLCNDCYKTPYSIKAKYSDQCEILTLPFSPGLTMVRKLPKEPPEWLENYEKNLQSK